MWLGLLAIAGLTYLFLWRLWANVPADRATLPIRSDLTEVFFPPRYYVSKTLAAVISAVESSRLFGLPPIRRSTSRYVLSHCPGASAHGAWSVHAGLGRI
jgi:hypothetical protein